MKSMKLILIAAIAASSMLRGMDLVQGGSAAGDAAAALAAQRDAQDPQQALDTKTSRVDAQSSRTAPSVFSRLTAMAAGVFFPRAPQEPAPQERVPEPASSTTDSLRDVEPVVDMAGATMDASVHDSVASTGATDPVVADSVAALSLSGSSSPSLSAVPHSVASVAAEAPTKHVSYATPRDAALVWASRWINPSVIHPDEKTQGSDIAVPDADADKLIIHVSALQEFSGESKDISDTEKATIRAAAQRVRFNVLCRGLGVKRSVFRSATDDVQYDEDGLRVSEKFLERIESDSPGVLKDIVNVCAQHVASTARTTAEQAIFWRSFCLKTVDLTGFITTAWLAGSAAQQKNAPGFLGSFAVMTAGELARRAAAKKIRNRAAAIVDENIEKQNPLIEKQNPLIAAQARNILHEQYSLKPCADDGSAVRAAILAALKVIGPVPTQDRESEGWISGPSGTEVTLATVAAPVSPSTPADPVPDQPAAAVDASLSISSSTVMVSAPAETDMGPGPTNPPADLRGKKNRPAREAWRQEQAAAGDKRFIDYLKNRSMIASSASSVGGSSKNA